MKKTLNSLIILLSITNICSQELSLAQRESIKKNEKEIIQLIKSKKVPNKNLYYIYLIAARDFELLKIEDYYLKYLLKAKSLNTEEDKSEVYWRLITHYKKIGNITKAKSTLHEWKKLNSSTSTIFTQAFILMDKQLSNIDLTLSKKQEDLLKNGPFAYKFNMQTLDEQIKKKNYARALSLINSKHIESQMISTIVRYDLLNTLVKKKRTSIPTCFNTYKNYPESPSYSMKICKSILEYNRFGKITQKTLIETKNIFSLKEYKNEAFLYDALLDL